MLDRLIPLAWGGGTSIQYYEPMNFNLSRETTNEREGVQFSLVASSEITLAQTKNNFYLINFVTFYISGFRRDVDEK
jgi:hypothetical protein